MTHIKRMDEMPAVNEGKSKGYKAKNDEFMKGVAKRYPEIAVDTGDKEYKEKVKRVKERAGMVKNFDLKDYEKKAVKCVGDVKTHTDDSQPVTVPNEILVQLWTMTDENYHVQARVEMARYLSMWSDEMYEFLKYYEMIDRDKKLRAERFHTASYPIMEELMFIKIDKIFGSETARALYACL